MILGEIVGNNTKKAHGYHMVHSSPWPLFTGLALFSIVLEFVAKMHEHERNTYYILFNIMILLIIILRWCSDISIEASFEGRHTKIVQTLLKKGFFYFILSEVMFFGALFGSYLYIITHPTIWVGCEWPPTELFELNPMKLPLANAFLLVASGMWGEVAHEAIELGLTNLASHYLGILMILGLAFLGVQLHEYISAPFGIDDGIYGSLFYFITGFHGAHVCFGLLFILVQYYRINMGMITRNHHIGFDLAIWYWHFVDIIWLIVWSLIYYYPTVL
jgi:heme/copper-type cytochrome/quinol oxidase subunit 3